MNVEREWYTIDDVAVILGRSSRAVRQAVYRKVIPSAFIAGRRLVPAEWLHVQGAEIVGAGVSAAAGARWSK